MPRINRNSIDDSKNIAENFLKDELLRKDTLKFLADGINYANQLNSENWNLNLDKNGNFIRFNVGHEYCMEIFKEEMNILCLKESLKTKINEKEKRIRFKGYLGKKKIFSYDINNIPDCLSKVPDSVGCFIKHDNLRSYLPLLKESNLKFIEIAAIKTRQRPNMRNAHSLGFLEYLNEMGMFENQAPINENRYLELQVKEKEEAKTLDDSKLKLKAQQAIKKPTKTIIGITKYVRNQYVVEYAKRKANGICQDCLEPAPFVNKSTGEPFLETHHIVPLAKNGEDTIENTIAICPNCHRKRHHG